MTYRTVSQLFHRLKAVHLVRHWAEMFYKDLQTVLPDSAGVQEDMVAAVKQEGALTSTLGRQGPYISLSSTRWSLTMSKLLVCAHIQYTFRTSSISNFKIDLDFFKSDHFWA